MLLPRYESTYGHQPVAVILCAGCGWRAWRDRRTQQQWYGSGKLRTVCCVRR